MSYGSLFGESKPVLVKEDLTPRRASVTEMNVQPLMNTCNTAVTPLVAEARQAASSAMKISEFGTAPGKEVAKLSDEILKQTTTSKMGDFGKGITDILKLTDGMKPDDLNLDKNKGMFSKISSWVSGKKVEVTSHFEDVSKQIERIATDLESRKVQMVKDNEFLDRLYDQNMKEYHALGHAVDALGYVIDEQKVQYQEVQAQAQASGDMQQIQAATELEDRIKQMEKQVDRLKRMQHVAMLTAPEIRSTQKGNVNTCQKFDDLMNTTLPAWKKVLSQTVLAARQKQNVELGNTLDDKTNEFFLKASELNANNRIAVAKASERSTVDVSTLVTMQENLVNSLKEVRQIEEDGRKEREQASLKIGELRESMKKEMLSWQK